MQGSSLGVFIRAVDGSDRESLRLTEVPEYVDVNILLAQRHAVEVGEKECS